MDKIIPQEHKFIIAKWLTEAQITSFSFRHFLLKSCILFCPINSNLPIDKHRNYDIIVWRKSKDFSKQLLFLQPGKNIKYPKQNKIQHEKSNIYRQSSLRRRHIPN